MISTPQYLSVLLSPEKFVPKFKRIIKNCRFIQHKTGFDSIAFTGLSGCLVAPMIAHSLKVAMIPVRRPYEHCHTGNIAEISHGYAYTKTLIIDDFIDSGATIATLFKVLRDEMPMVEVIGIALHRTLDSATDKKLQRTSTSVAGIDNPLPLWYV